MRPVRYSIDAAKKYVVSRTLGRVDWNAELVRGELGKAVQQLKREPGKAWLAGSGESMFGFFKKKPATQFPPVPRWRPGIQQPLDRVIDRFGYYNDNRVDFAVFENGTCVALPAGLSETDAGARAREILANIFHFHPDMRANPMDDGNILVTYNEPAGNVVLHDVVEANWPEIERNHQDALTTSEVLITPLGPNVFDEFGKAALFGRCFMFMDARDPRIVKVVRSTA